ncbi:MAG TPA: iron-sulfur cluster assembly protein, partial [Pelolinea sp.]|nr:iron-sulfur cluster assembly protein [Pelolinea sp.]
MTEEKKAALFWDAETESTEMCEKIRQALRDVRDPEIGMDVIQLGLIRNVTLKDNKLDLVMILTT